MLSIFKKLLLSITKDFRLIIGNYFNQIASVLFGIYIAEKILPESYGVFGLMILLITYLKFLNFGAQFTINRRLSIRKNSPAALSYLKLNILIFPFFAALILIILKYFDFFPELNSYYIYMWVFLSFDNIYQLLQGFLRARDRSKQLGHSKFLIGLVIFILLIYFLNWEEKSNPIPLLVKHVLAPVAGLFYFLSIKSVRDVLIYRIKIKISVLKYFLAEGLALGIYVFMQDFLASIDRLFIALNYSIYDLGIYSFAMSLSGPIMLILSTIIFMDYSRNMNAFNNINKLDFYNLNLEITKKLISLFILIVLFSIPVIYLLLNFYLLEYKLAFPLIVLMLLGNISVPLSFSYSLYFISNKMTNILVKILLFGLCFNLLFNSLILYYELSYVFLICTTVLTKFCIYVIMRFKLKKII